MDFIDGHEPDGTNLKHMAPLFGDMLPGEQQREANMNRMKAMRAERKFKVHTRSSAMRALPCSRVAFEYHCYACTLGLMLYCLHIVLTTESTWAPFQADVGSRHAVHAILYAASWHGQLVERDRTGDETPCEVCAHWLGNGRTRRKVSSGSRLWPALGPLSNFVTLSGSSVRTDLQL
eukprot:COSAG02_NODE_229_length_28128_cov_18.529131_12_plen_177_part_00